MTWSNGPLTVYHGTDERSAAAITSRLPNGINLSLCKPRTDFGQGFYTTTRLHQAKNWANNRCRRMARAGVRPPVVAVITFEIDRDKLAGLQSLAFMRETTDFWDFVEHCRAGRYSLHGRAGGIYDVVYGLVTVWTQTLILADCDQVSFHTNSGIAILDTFSSFTETNSPDGLFRI